MAHALKLVLGALLLTAAGAAGGYVVGKRTSSGRARGGHAIAEAAAPAETTAGPVRATAPGDYQALKNELAICMAYHPPADEMEKQLAMCRASLAAYQKPRPTFPDCYEFADIAPFYDLKFGEADPSPETIERAARLTADDCVSILEWSTRADTQQAACLKGDMPPGWKERYGRPIGDRPFVKVCNAETKSEAMNAWFRREEHRLREMGHGIKNQIRMSPDGGYRAYPHPSDVAPGFDEK